MGVEGKVKAEKDKIKKIKSFILFFVSILKIIRYSFYYYKENKNKKTVMIQGNYLTNGYLVSILEFDRLRFYML